MLDHDSDINKAVINSILSLTNALYHPPLFNMMTKEELRDALSTGQIESKKWLLHNLVLEAAKYPFPQMKIVVAGGWIGLLSAAINHLNHNWQADSLDLLEKNYHIAHLVLDKLQGQSIMADMYQFDYSSYNCVINTSTEHIAHLQSWLSLIPTGTFVVLQNNNSAHLNGHINCATSVDDFLNKAQLRQVLFSGELKFPFYHRYMIIGLT